MKPLSDEDLILYYYGEVGDRQVEEIEQHLAVSAALRSRYEALRKLLDAVQEEAIPERAPAYGSRVWHRIAPQLGRRGFFRDWSWLGQPRRWAWASTLVVLLVTAFLAGRMSPRDGANPPAGLPEDGRNRILLMTVAGHLERSEMLLLELVNTHDNGEFDLSMERQLASELGRQSRLYRQAARQAGKADVAALLEQLETILLELSNGPQIVASAELGELRLRLEEGDVLFKVRILGSRLRHDLRDGRRIESGGSEHQEI